MPKIPENQLPKFTLIFDIDNVLADTSAPPKAYEQVANRSGTIMAANTKHYLYPGIIELLRWLYTKPYIEIAFFSAGAAHRNIEFVHKLLNIIFEQDQNQRERFLQTTIILSREDLSTISEDQASLTHRQYQGVQGRDKKDIEKVLCKIPGSSLQNSIFIDDNEGYMKVEQARQFLKSPCGSMYTIRSSPNKNNDLAFYLAYLLSECFALFENGNDVGEFLFNFQFNIESMEPSPRYRFNYDYGEPSANTWYIKGLQLLRTINPALTFMLDPETVLPDEYLSRLQSELEQHNKYLRELKWFFEDGHRALIHKAKTPSTNLNPPQMNIFIQADLLFDEQYEADLGRENCLFLLRQGGIVRHKDSDGHTKEYQVLPGVRELIQFLFRHPNVRVGVYGKKSKLIEIVLKKILALDDETYSEALRSKLNIFESEERLLTSLQTMPTVSLRHTMIVTAYPISTFPREVQLEVPRGYVPGSRYADYNKRFYQHNLMFYIAGILKRMLNEIETNGYLSAATKFIQYKQDESYRLEHDWEHYKDRSYYDAGLSFLQQMNSGLVIVNTENINSVTENPLSDDEEEIVGWNARDKKTLGYFSF